MENQVGEVEVVVEVEVAAEVVEVAEEVEQWSLLKSRDMILHG